MSYRQVERTNVVHGGKDESGYDRNQLAKRYNQETKQQGKRVTRKAVSHLPFFMGC